MVVRESGCLLLTALSLICLAGCTPPIATRHYLTISTGELTKVSCNDAEEMIRDGSFRTVTRDSLQASTGGHHRKKHEGPTFTNLPWCRENPLADIVRDCEFGGGSCFAVFCPDNNEDDDDGGCVEMEETNTNYCSCHAQCGSVEAPCAGES